MLKKFCKKIGNTGEASRLIKLLKGNSIVGNCTLKKADNNFTKGPQDTLQLLLDKHFPSVMDDEAFHADNPNPNNDILQFINPSTVKEAIFSFIYKWNVTKQYFKRIFVKIPK